MALPKIDSPLFTIELPSNKRKIRYRPFTVKEEKLLLLASESNDAKFINDTIKQVLNNCFAEDVDIDKLATFDVEYLFVQLRAKSVNNIIQLRFKDDNDKTQKVEVDLDDVVVEFDKEHTNKIPLSSDVVIVMKYPSFEMFEDMTDIGNDLTKVLKKTIDKIVNGDELLDINDYTDEEVEEFINSFTSKNMRDIEKFFQTLPKLKLDVNYKDSDGNDKTREVVGLQSFFTF